MAPSAGNRKVANSLVTLSSAAILVVYAAGFMKTRAAAAKLEEASNDRERRPSMPAPPTAGETRTPDRIEPPTRPETKTAAALTSPVMPKPEAGPATAATMPTATTVTAATAATPAAQDKTHTAATETSAPATAAEPATSAPAAGTTPDTSAPHTATKSEEKEKPAGLLWPKEHYNDGTFLGWGTSRHGDIQASVTVKDGRIVATSIAQCWTRYSCSWVAHLPGQVLTRQGPEVDYVSGATQSANAFYWAVVDALNKAK